MLELGEWYPEGETALLDSLDFLDFADGQVEQEGLHSGSEAFMRQSASFGEHYQDREAVVGECSPRRRPDCAGYPVSPRATREAGARAFGEGIPQVRVIFLAQRARDKSGRGSSVLPETHRHSQQRGMPGSAKTYVSLLSQGAVMPFHAPGEEELAPGCWSSPSTCSTRVPSKPRSARGASRDKGEASSHAAGANH